MLKGFGSGSTILTKTIDLSGDERLIRQLRALEASLAGKFLEDILEPGAKLIRDSAIQKAPRSNRNVKNHLKDSIEYTTVEKSRYRVTMAIGVRSGKGYPGGLAHMVEFGTGIRRAKKTTLAFISNGRWIYPKEVGPSPAQPFLRPAFDENIDKAIQLVRERVEQKCRQAAAL